MPQFQSYPSVTTVAPDDLVLIHQDASGVEKTVKYSDLLSSGYVINVKAYGAVGNGTTDDSAAVQAAFNASIPGSVVLFPATANSYIINTPINVPTSGITVIGYGAALSQTADTQYRKFTLTNRGQIRFEGLYILGGYSSMSPVVNNGTINITNSNLITITNCYFFNTAAANIYVSGDCGNIKIDNNNFSNNYCPIIATASGGFKPYRLQIANNSFRTSGITTTSSANSASIWINGAGVGSQDNTISNNVIASNAKYGIRLESSVIRTAVSGNSISNTANGVYIDNSTDIAVTGNTLNNILNEGIFVNQGSNIDVSSNVVNTTDSNSNGIKFTDVTRGTIAANNVESAGDAAVIINSLSPVISGNTFRTTGEQVMIIGGAGAPVSNFSVTGNNLTAAGAGTTRYHIKLDATSGLINNGLITNNFFSGNVLDAGILLYSPSGNSINDINITGNNTTNAAASSGRLLSFDGTVSPQTVINRVWSFGNTGQPNDLSASLNADYFETTASIAIPYVWPVFQNGTVGVDATAGARTFELPPAADSVGYRVTITKIDSSANHVTINGYGGIPINGAATYVLRTQNESVTIINSDSGWRIESLVNKSYTLVYRGSNQAIPNTAETDIVWQNANENAAGSWNVVNPARLNVPAGATRVRVSINFRWAYNASGTQRIIKIKASGGPVPVFATSSLSPAGVPASFGTSASLSTPILKVSDLPSGSASYFYATATQDSGGNLDLFGDFGVLNFQLEVIE